MTPHRPRLLLTLALTLAAGIGTPPPAAASSIAQACSASARAAGNIRLCGCIQQVADRTLTRRDQRLAASFFQDPHLAQEMRTSDRARDEAFWERYKGFAATAERYCR